jgi:thymidine phosphorylase
MEKQLEQGLRLKRLNIDTGKSTQVYLHHQCDVLKLKGFSAGQRICVGLDHKFILANLNIVYTDILKPDEASLSEYAWQLLAAESGISIFLSYPDALQSLNYIRGKILGKRFTEETIHAVMSDISVGYLSDVHISAFLTACAAKRLSEEETIALTKAMVDVGKRIKWNSSMVVDKHCIGGIPGNRTTMIVVPIVAAYGLMIPKSSSRAITSSAGTADTMEVLAPVNLSFCDIQKVVQQENGCVVWGGTSDLSPVDDILINVERELDLDSTAQVVSSILSKKIAAGSSYLVIDIPIGPTAKVRRYQEALQLKTVLERVGSALGLQVKVLLTDGGQPVGYGIGPALEARDVVDVLKNEPHASQLLRERSLLLAGHILEFSPKVKSGEGQALAEEILTSGKAWKKFQAICKAQGGMRIIPKAEYTHTVIAKRNGFVNGMDNRRLAHLAKAAGAPQDPAAGVDLHVLLQSRIKHGQPLLTIHAESLGELEYAKDYWLKNESMIKIGS